MHLPGTDKTLHETLTQLLMDNGAAVTKTSIDELIKFIAARDHRILSHVINNVERDMSTLGHETQVS